jgi:ABC-type transporter Mla maintaining outer membrane lipid asymmetry ATPase subunit MlaF
MNIAPIDATKSAKPQETQGLPSGAPAGAPAVRITGVTHRYGETIAVDDLSLDIPSARMVGIIGPDGGGKSPLMALLAGSKSIQQVKTGLPGMAYVQLDPQAQWPERLQAGLVK